MRKRKNFKTPFFSVLTISCCIICVQASAQQFVVDKKDIIHRELPMDNNNIISVRLSDLNVIRNIDYNEIRWQASTSANVSRYIVEYSTNGVDYKTAGDVATNAPLVYKHYFNRDLPILYRVKVEQANGRFAYSPSYFVDGINISPVQVYPTIVTGNALNINATWPVERITVVSTDGVVVFAKEINGQRDYINLAIPTLAKGMYWVTSYGHGWKTSAKILIS